MTIKEKNEIMAQVSALLDRYVCDEKKTSNSVDDPPVMLTIKECTEYVKGLTEHTVRLLIARGEISSIRTGEGKRGKILVLQSSLLDYIRGISEGAGFAN